MARGYSARSKRAGKPKGFRNINQSTPGGSYDGKPSEDDPRFNPKRDGNKRGRRRPQIQFPVDDMKKQRF